MNYWAFLTLISIGMSACTTTTCKVDDVVVKTVSASVATGLSCTAKLEILDDLTALADHDCQKRQELLDALPTGAYSGLQQDCLILGDEVSKLLKDPPPSSWACKGSHLDLRFSKICDDKELR